MKYILLFLTACNGWLNQAPLSKVDVEQEHLFKLREAPGPFLVCAQGDFSEGKNLEKCEVVYMPDPHNFLYKIPAVRIHQFNAYTAHTVGHLDTRGGKHGTRARN